MKHLEETVKPQRASNNRSHTRDFWWQFEHYRAALYDAVQDYESILLNSQVSSHLCFAFKGSNIIFSHALNIFLITTFSQFCCLQSRLHEVWARFFASSLEDRLRYTPTDCFETFPFPENWKTNPTLEEIGKIYYEYRADLMVRNNQGLTDTYNRFHDPNEFDPDLLKLRELREQMDRAVLDAYGWSDVDTTCGFALDYLDIDPDELPAEVQDRIASGDLFFPTIEEASTFDSLVRTGKSKLPWRYRWPESTHDEVLARLLELNQKRYEEEVLGGKHAEGKQKKATKKAAKSKKADDTPLFPGLSL
jgi:hypothetical protein